MFVELNTEAGLTNGAFCVICLGFCLGEQQRDPILLYKTLGNQDVHFQMRLIVGNAVGMFTWADPIRFLALDWIPPLVYSGRFNVSCERKSLIPHESTDECSWLHLSQKLEGMMFSQTPPILNLEIQRISDNQLLANTSFTFFQSTGLSARGRVTQSGVWTSRGPSLRWPSPTTVVRPRQCVSIRTAWSDSTTRRDVDHPGPSVWSDVCVSERKCVPSQ